MFQIYQDLEADHDLYVSGGSMCMDLLTSDGKNPASGA